MTNRDRRLRPGTPKPARSNPSGRVPGNGCDDGRFCSEDEEPAPASWSPPRSSLPPATFDGKDNGGIAKGENPSLPLPLPVRSGRKRDDAKRGCFLFVASLMVLTPAIIGVARVASKTRAISSSSNSNSNNDDSTNTSTDTHSAMRFRDNFEDPNDYSLFSKHQGRLLNDVENYANLSMNFDDDFVFENNTDQSTEYRYFVDLQDENETRAQNATDANDSDNAVGITVIDTEANESFMKNDTDANIFNNTLTPTIILDPTDPPSIDPTSSHSPTLFPTRSIKPSSTPTISFNPTVTGRPTISVSPTNVPSLSPTSVPTARPTTSISPSANPTSFPSKSMAPVGIPSATPTGVPTVSIEPSIMPSMSFLPTISSEPTQLSTPKPTVGTKYVTQVRKMRLRNLPAKLSEDQISIWETLTEDHIRGYYDTFAGLYPDDWVIQINDANITFDSQNIDEADREAPSENDEPATVAPSTARNSVPSTNISDALSSTDTKSNNIDDDDDDENNMLTIQITYSQSVVYGTFEGYTNVTEEELHDLFVLPFTTDSFRYSNDLVKAMNWSNWVKVDIIDLGPPVQPLQQKPSNKLMRTIIFSCSIVLAACLLVAFLLWERNFKGEATNNTAANSSGMREDASASSTINGPPPSSRPPSELQSMEWNELYLTEGANRSGSNKTRNDTKANASWPRQLSRNFGGGRRGKPESRENPTIPNSGVYNATERSFHSKDSSISSNQEDSPKNFTSEENTAAHVMQPQQPASKSSRVRRALSLTGYNPQQQNTVVRGPLLPPLPPPNTEIEGGSSNAQCGSHARVLSGEFTVESASQMHQQPPNRQGIFGMRVAASMEDSMTMISQMSEQFPSERGFFNGDFGTQQQSRLDTFTSPLHIPDEDAMQHNNLTPPESPMPTMLGLELAAIDDVLTPIQGGFVMKVEDIEDIEN